MRKITLKHIFGIVTLCALLARPLSAVFVNENSYHGFIACFKYATWLFGYFPEIYLSPDKDTTVSEILGAMIGMLVTGGVFVAYGAVVIHIIFFIIDPDDMIRKYKRKLQKWDLIH